MMRISLTEKRRSWLYVVWVIVAVTLQSTAFTPQQLTQANCYERRNELKRNGLSRCTSLSRVASCRCRIQPSKTSLSSSNDVEAPKKRPERSNPFARAVRKLVSFQSRTAARFRSLSKRSRRILLVQFMFLCLLFGGVAKNYASGQASPRPIEVAYSSFLDLVEQQNQAGKSDVPVLDQVRVGTDRIVYRIYRNSGDQKLPLESLNRMVESKQKLKQNKSPYFNAYTRKVPASPELVNLFRSNDLTFTAAPAAKSSVLALTLRSFMVTFYFLILWRLYQTVSGASGGSSKDVPGKLARTSDLPMASFDDIQGIDDAKTEVMELVDTLRFPDKYAVLGARAPTGLLLEGPPGTGKTMLARATAASAGVPLLYCSGSDFVEMFVGRGAARVRKLFERAEKLSPCIIFVDELDALGKARDTGGLGGSAFSRSNDEAEQTLNQLLACMDGLDSSKRICVLAATNRKEVLDPALIRPGRFDRMVKLKLPDAVGREKILRVHCRKLPGFTEGTGIDPNRPGSLGKGRVVDLSALAALTDGLSGADLEFLVNEAAIRAVRRVSAALKAGKIASDITPHVEAADFEASLANFYETRKSKGVGSMLKDMWK